MVKNRYQGFCNKCGKLVKHLPNHRRSLHKEKLIICGYCNKSVSEPHLPRHTQTHHPGFKPKKHKQQQICPHCNRDFEYSSHEFYMNHVVNCLQNPASEFLQNSFSCTFCDKKFTTRHNLLLHTKRRHESDEVIEGEPASEQEVTEFLDESYDPQQLFDEIKHHQQKSKKFKASEKMVKFKISELGLRLCRAGLILPVISKVLTNVINIGQYDPESLICVTIDSPGLDHGHTSGLQVVKNFHSDVFLMELEKIIDSSDVIRLQNDELSIEVRNIDLRAAVKGPGKKLKIKDFVDITQFLKRKNGLADPADLKIGPNLMESCFIISIAMSLYANGRNIKQLFKNGNFPHALETLVCTIYKGIYLEIDTAISAQHYMIIGNYLQREYKRNLVIYDITNQSSKVKLIYKHALNQPNPLAVLTAAGHCWLITNMNLFFTSKGYCPKCYVSMEPKFHHQCTKKCLNCQSNACSIYTRQKPSVATQICEDCNGLFIDNFCFNQHKIKTNTGNSCCDDLKRCRSCGKRLKSENIDPERHHCLKTKCFNCNEWVDLNHKCYLRAPAEQHCIKPNIRLLYFDIETRETSEGYLIPFIFCLIQTCAECASDIHGDLFGYYDCCKSNRTKIWFGDECMKEACSYIFYNKSLSGSVLIAHNFSRFDGFFIYQTLVSMGKQPTILIRSNRLLSLQCGLNVKCICSLNFFHCKLEKLSQMFGLGCEKEFLPIKLLKNLDPNKNIKGWVPPPESWQPELMSKERQTKFEEHYAELKASTEKFDLFNMLKGYCVRDTKMLYQSCQKFRELLISETGICPFSSGCITLTGLTVKVWKKKFLQSDQQSRMTTIGLIPDMDLKANLIHKQSLLARCYISWLQFKNPFNVIHYAGNGREHRIGNKWVDALIHDKDGNPLEALEVNGCFWHAHMENCDLFANQNGMDIHPIFKPLRWVDVYAQTLFRQKELEDESLLTIAVIYECEIYRLLKDSPEMASYFDRYKEAEKHRRPLNPREALYGGRVTQGVLLAELSDFQIDDQDWLISHLDLNSLYPAVMADNPFPEGHPVKIDGWALEKACCLETLRKYFGLVHCRVLPPKDILLYPPLPLRVKDRLTFPLCRTCAEGQNHYLHCTHDDDERSWVGTYCTPELINSMEQFGYTVLDVYQIWHFDKTSDGIFRSFVNHWAALKFRCSGKCLWSGSDSLVLLGFPNNVQTEDEKRQYVETINGKYECNLQVAEIVINEPMRNVAKLLSNSLWGRLGMSSSKSRLETKLVVSISDLKSVLSVPGISIRDARIVATDRLLLTIEKNVNYVPTDDRHANIVLAAFTLSYARMVLQKMLSRVDYNTCYTDTDSIIFLHKRGSPLVPEETFLYGGWKSETPKNHIIRSWICLGPKVYCYKTAEIDPITGKLKENGKSKVVMKAKGMQIDCRKGVSFEEMKAVLEESLKHLIGQENTSAELNKRSITIPDPTMRRNLMQDPQGVIKNCSDRVKKLNFGLMKRQYLFMPNDSLSVHRTIPWGLRFDCS